MSESEEDDGDERVGVYEAGAREGPVVDVAAAGMAGMAVWAVEVLAVSFMTTII